MKNFLLRIITPSGVEVEQDVVLLSVNAAEGIMGLLYDHEPVISNIKMSNIHFIDTSNQKVNCAISDGILDFADNVATLICEWFNLATQLNLQELNDERARLEAILLEKGDDERVNDMLDIVVNKIKAANTIN